MKNNLLKKISLSILGLGIAINSIAQAPNYAWAKSAGGNLNDFATDNCIDGNGNVYVTGKFKSASITFGTITLTNANAGVNDLFIVKYDPSGNVLWAKSAGGTGDDFGYSVSTDANGNVFVVGGFYSSSITFGSTILTNSGASLGDAFIIEYDPMGNVLWAKGAGGSGGDYGYGVSTDVSGNVYMSGTFSSGSITFGSITLTSVSSGTPDIFIVKYNSSGNVLWAKSAGGTYFDYVQGISTDGSGNVYITGNFESSSITFGSITLNNVGGTNPGTDAFIVKYDASGTVLWAKKIGGTDYQECPGISTDASGNIYVIGVFRGSITIGSTTLTNANTTSDLFIAKYDANGNAFWAKSSDDVYPSDITADASGNTYLTGVYDATITFGTSTLTCAGPSDMFIVKYDVNGNIVWAKGDGGIGDDGISSSCLDANGNLYITGGSGTSALSLGSTTLTNAGGYDMFFAKLNSTTGIADIENNNDINIYPNPSSGQINLSGKNINNATVRLVDLRGQVLLQKTNVSGDNLTLDVSEYANGIYIVEVIQSESVERVKMVKE